jgi:hypothetical protein
MHFKEAKGILSATGGMNISRGCVHGCIYCDSRSKCYHIEHDFEDVEIKSNAPMLLEEALKKKRDKIMVGTGAMSDPYIPIPENLENIRRCLEIIDKYACGLAIQTKSDLILRDLDALLRINEKAKCIVEMTMTTYDENLCRILEPNVCGILCFGIGMTLREGDREYFYSKLDVHFPGMKERYIKKYGLSYEIASDQNAPLMKLLHDTCDSHNIVYGPDRLFEYMRTFEGKKGTQMELF